MTVRNIKTREGYEIWDKLCAIPRYGFLLAPEGNRVVKVEGIGNWIDMHKAQEVVDAAQDEVNGLRAQRDQLLAALENLLDEYVEEVQSERMATSGLKLSREEILSWPGAAANAAAIAAAKGGAE